MPPKEPSFERTDSLKISLGKDTVRKLPEKYSNYIEVFLEEAVVRLILLTRRIYLIELAEKKMSL